MDVFILFRIPIIYTFLTLVCKSRQFNEMLDFNLYFVLFIIVGFTLVPIFGYLAYIESSLELEEERLTAAESSEMTQYRVLRSNAALVNDDSDVSDDALLDDESYFKFNKLSDYDYEWPDFEGSMNLQTHSNNYKSIRSLRSLQCNSEYQSYTISN
ncbi:hypothetical protein Ocin01_11450 [Orchesella cincta]|uniref:Uncharacterized protein n=1 Tax=Orchesella cincta TaxID=48709 RepID=A0A1D2MQT3_ORCCI|nr:hypothetical protein Ocin01_11450 [Orchesella cincta]